MGWVWASCWRRRSAAASATISPPRCAALLSAALLFLTPMSFLISTTRNCRLLSDWLALAFGLVLGLVGGGAVGAVARSARNSLMRSSRS